MAKTQKRKKKNFRLRRSVRRTLGALFLMTAIIVAAIPFPDAAATDGTEQTQADGGQGNGGSETTPLTRYKYPESPSADTNIFMGGPSGQLAVERETLNGPDGVAGTKDDITNVIGGKPALITRTTTSGQFMIYKQFDYLEKQFQDENGGNLGTYAYIAKYNQLYATDSVELIESIYTGYVVAGESESGSTESYETYFNDGNKGGKENTLVATNPNDKKELDAFFATLPAYKKYLEDTAAGIVADANIKVTPSVDLDYDLRADYYCFKEYPKYYNAGYKLKEVLDKRDADSGTAKDKYIYMFTGTQDIPGMARDLNGFLINGTVSIIGIGENAFAGVNNVHYMTIPSEINYIGDSAFEGSFLQEVVFEGAKSLGNYAFKGCTELKKVTMGEGLSKIGTETFAGCLQLQTVELPYSVSKIGVGAFANCKELTNVNLDPVKPGTGDRLIGEGAFYNCKLGNLNFGSTSLGTIGKGAFATDMPGSDGLTQVDMSKAGFTTIEDQAFSGRSALKTIIMPGEYGSTAAATLPENVFAGCINLERVEFPEQCAKVTYAVSQGEKSKIFTDVQNEQFAVKGPAVDQTGVDAAERQSTRGTLNGLDKGVPYVFEKDGVEYYELQEDPFLFTVIPDGSTMTAVVSSCKVEGSLGKDNELRIPANVGPYKVVRLEEGCFSDDVRRETNSLVVEHGSIEEIGPSVFKDFGNMTSVFLGDSVKSIGESAFRDCGSLQEVTIGKNITNIGADAFRGCQQLSEVVFEHPDNVSSLPLSNIGANAFLIDENETGSSKLTFTGRIDPDYGPYAYAMDPATFINEKRGIRVCYRSGDPEGYTVILDNRNNYPTLVDYRAYSDLEKIPAKDINGQETNLLKKYEDPNEAGNLNALETYIIDSVFNIRIPRGIKSIDVKGFMTDKSRETEDATHSELSNSINVAAYLSPGANTKAELPEEKYQSYLVYGLFNGNFPDYSGDTSIGNDVIRTVVMEEIKYLPNSDASISGDILSDHGLSGGAFYDCDELTGINMGGTIDDLGELPVLGAHKLTEVVFSDSSGAVSPKFSCENGIIYENLEDGSKKIVQALGSRGANQDGRVSVESDPHLENTSVLAKGAFSDIPQLASVSFEGNSALRELPDYTFFNDPLLSRVTLPDSLRIIGEHAFGNCGAGMDVYIYGREVSMATTAFDNTPNPTVYTYKDTAAYNTAVKVVGPNNVQAIPEGFRVQFFDYDGITALTDVQYVEQGKNAEPPEEDPKREGYIFSGWNKPYKDIQAHTDIIALYDIDPNGPYGGGGTGGTNKPGEGNDGVEVPGGVDLDGDGKPDMDENGNKLYTLTVSNGTGGGRYPAGKKVSIQAGAAPDGAGFTHWSSTNAEVIFNDATKPSTTLTMPAADTTVVSNFAGYYRLDVVYGSGSGSYPAGAKVEIKAVDAPQGRSFASWKSSTSGLTIENSRKQTTTVTMPKSNATVTATYMDNGSLSGNSTNKNSQNGTKVQITKPGIPNTDKASAYVSGSSDSFIVKISESAEATEAVQKALQAKYPDMTRVKYFAMDISLYDATGTRKITDTTGLKINITIPIPEALKEYAGNNKIAAVVNGQIEDLAPKFVTIDGVPCISFTATHFSPYTVYVDTANLTVTNTLDSTPKTGDGIHPKWFLSIGLACISMILFLKKDKKYTTRLS